jgi:uncharacterized protein YkwD
MFSMKKNILHFMTGLIIGAVAFGGGTAYAAGVIAQPTWQAIYVNGQQVEMTAYNINGNNFVKLRDIGKAVGINVYWENGVQIDTTSPYTGEAPTQAVTQTTAEVSGTQDIEAVRQEMVQRINQVRKENGLPELPTNEALMNAAQNCSAQEFRKHDQQYEWSTLAACGWPYGGAFNLTWFSGASNLENIAQKAVTNWVNSSGHLQTMLRDDATCLGVGVTVSNNIAYCYMIVGDPTGHSPLE